MDSSAHFPKKLLLGIIILILLLVYAVFWLKFFGVSKLPFALPITRQQPYQEQQEKIDKLIIYVTSIEKPLDPRVSQEAHVGTRDTLVGMLNRAKKALQVGDIETAQKELNDAKNQLIGMGDPLDRARTRRISDEDKKKEDPLDRFIKNDDIDERLYGPYLDLIKVKRSVDPEYQKAATAPVANK